MKRVNAQHFSRIRSLRNRYFVLRHGESQANVAKLIVGDPAVGTDEFGLTEKGFDQIKSAFGKETVLTEDCIILSSDFKRARQTAQCAHKAIGCSSEITYQKALRERFFGEFEQTDTSNYKKIWANDLLCLDSVSYYGVEPVSSVVERVLGLLLAQEETYEGRDILLVSHGDVLQMLQTTFERIESSLHREVQHLATAEIRGLILSDLQ